MRALKTVGIVAIVLVAAVLVYQVVVNNKHLPQTPATAQQEPSESAAEKPLENQPSQAGETQAGKPLQLSEAEPEDAAAPANTPNNQLSSSYPPLAAYEIGNEPITDDALIELVNRLNNDPALLADLINDLRAETDPERLQRLVYILGSTANSAVLPAATEMIYSGITSSRDMGLDLLSRVASNNPEAYEVASSLLVSETEPSVIVATLNVMAKPGMATPEVRESMITQIMPLSTHESTAVRGFSVATLARLSNDPDMAPVFFNALYDSEPAVRSSGVYAFSSFPYHTAEASQKLLDMVEDESEHMEVRRGAMLALSNNSPDELTRSRVDAVELKMRQQARKQRISGQ